MTTNHDDKILELQKKIKQKSEQIKKSARPQYLTNSAFPTDKGTKNLLTVQTESELVELCAVLHANATAHAMANKLLGTNIEFKLNGYSTEEWIEDFQTRLATIRINSERAKLKKLETLLADLESEDLKTQKALQSIEDALSET